MKVYHGNEERKRKTVPYYIFFLHKKDTDYSGDDYSTDTDYSGGDSDTDYSDYTGEQGNGESAGFYIPSKTELLPGRNGISGIRKDPVSRALLYIALINYLLSKNAL